MSQQPPNYYDILKVSRNSTIDEIKQSYKQLAKQHHPDKGGSKEKFQEIQTAYEILSDENKRREYDNPQPQFNPFFNGQQHPPPNFPFNFFNFSNNGPPTGGDGMIKKNDENYNCNISLKDVYFGTYKKFHIKRKIKCEKCNIDCVNCNGTGFDKNNQRIQIGPFIHIQNQVCNLCNGQGFKKLPFCNDCNNSGFTVRDINIEILIPKGVENGKTYFYEGCGEQAMKRNEINGNFIVTIIVIEDNIFKRSNNFNLIFDQEISFKESIIGKDIVIPHMQETINLNIKKFCIINPNKNYIITGKGLQDELGKKGDLIIKFKIIYPERTLNDDEINTLESVFSNIKI